MKIEARHVRRKQLQQYIDPNFLKRERKLSESSITSPGIQIIPSNKRKSNEIIMSTSTDKQHKKRHMHHESVSYFVLKICYRNAKNLPVLLKST